MVASGASMLFQKYAVRVNYAIRGSREEVHRDRRGGHKEVGPRARFALIGYTKKSTWRPTAAANFLLITVQCVSTPSAWIYPELYGLCVRTYRYTSCTDSAL